MTDAFSLPPLRSLRPEELEPLSLALAAHLRQNYPLLRFHAEKTFHLQRGEAIPAFVFKLDVLLEIRGGKVERRTERSTPEKVKALIPPLAAVPAPSKRSIDVWQYPSENRPDFSAHVGHYFIPETCREEPCRDCAQRGEIGCRVCGGKGELDCSTCHGSGRIPCVQCHGKKTVSCLRCGGQGRFLSGAGGRSVRCDLCEGTGHLPCKHCEDGQVPCLLCQSSGKTVCPNCSGPGRIPCPVCGGDKKIISGQSFSVEFKPFQVESSALLVVGPPEVQSMALEALSPGQSFSLQNTESLEDQWASMDIPASLMPAFLQLSDREKSHLSPGARSVKRRLHWAEGWVIRLQGYCGGQPFVFWTAPGKTKFVMEKDPSLFMANANFLLAKDFLTLGDWRKSLFLAQETLSLDPHHTGALEIRSSWRKRIVREVFMGGISFVLLFWVLNTVWFVFVEPGVHKTLAVFVNGLVLLVVGFLAGLLILPVLFPIRLFRYRAVVLVGFFSLALWGGPSFFRREFHWDPIRFADQKALDQEMTQHFKFGVPEVYHAPDLGFLERLDTRYKSSRADKTWLNEALKRQRFLKAQKEEEQKKFDRTVADIIASNQSLKKKKDLLKKAEAMARLTQLNVTSSQNALTPVEKKENERAFKRLRQPPPRIRIGMGDQRR